MRSNVEYRQGWAGLNAGKWQGVAVLGKVDKAWQSAILPMSKKKWSKIANGEATGHDKNCQRKGAR